MYEVVEVEIFSLAMLISLLNNDLDFDVEKQFDNIVKQFDYNFCKVSNMLIDVDDLQVKLMIFNNRCTISFVFHFDV